MRKVNNLKIKIWEKGLTQREVAKKAGIDEGRLSLIVNGRYLPDQIQRVRIAQAVGLPVSDLFIE